MLLEDTDVYVDAQGYPLFTMSITRAPWRRVAISGRCPKWKGLLFRMDDGGACRDRTDDLKLAKLALSQLS